MKVTGPSSTGNVGGAKASRPTAGQGAFNLPTAGAAGAAGSVSRAGAVGGVGGIEALLALQDVGGPLERRKRAVGRAGRILDVLDDIKLALLDGDLSPAALDRLVRAVREERQNTDDGALEGVLDDIETRAAVEIAKLEQARLAA